MLEKATLKPADRRSWMARRVAALTCAALGVIGFVAAGVVGFAMEGTLPKVPTPYLTFPMLGAVLASAGISLARHEQAYALLVFGVSLGACAVVVGWAVYGLVAVLVLAAIALVLGLF